MRRTILVAALAGLVATPALASSAGMPLRASMTSAHPAGALSLLAARRGATLRPSNSLEGQNTLLLVAGAALVGGVIGYFIGHEDDDEDRPASP